ncbi:hypothetical protein NBRC110019_20830 [Neptunitalea chrysea]|uniref:Uncharacterized protein n=1 Tax=Neptunitalea chrysea TaxID=1647581 RepID=A0A9W6B5J7_9FLAO|nr:hypothetical protein [Neptunitalea chrysea]GLB53043.1 hypothetical protein NBRC110019_20830 [Neptunitalea chrysea]
MQVEVFFDEQRLDIDDSTKISESKQVNDFFDIVDRQTSYTNTFKLPKTERNRKIFGGHAIPGTTSLVPYRLHKVSIYRDGLPTVLDGTGYLKQTTNSYNLYVYSDVVNLFDTVADKKLANLNLAMYNHTLKQETFLSSFDNTEGYIYPIADYGKLDNGVVEWNYTVPAMYVKSLWNRIFQEAGFTYEYKGRVPAVDNPFNPFITAEWDELAITINEGFSNDLDSNAEEHILQLYRSGTVERSQLTYVNIFGVRVVVQKLDGDVTDYLKFTTEIDSKGVHRVANSQQYNRSRIRIKEDGFYKLNITGQLYNSFTEGLSMYVEKNGINLLTVIEGVTDDVSDLSLSERLYLKEGDELFLKIVATSKEHEILYTYTINLDLYTDNMTVAVNFSSYFDDISQKEFIKDIMWQFGLLCRRKGTVYEFISVEELLSPMAYYSGYTVAPQEIYVDWSDKLHSVVSLDTQLGSYAKSNVFLYQYTDSNATFANGRIKVDDDTLDAEKELIQRIYNAPASTTTLYNDYRLRSIPLYQKEYEDDGTLKEVKKVKLKSFLIRVQKSEGILKYKQSDADNYYSINRELPYATFTELDWNFIIPERYAAFGNMLNYGQKYTVNLLINVSDINQLDFFKLVYIKQLGSLFYINKISNYTGEGFTKAELIRVRSTERLSQFSDDFSADFSS